MQSAAPVADEIIIIDTGSTDKTLDIARKYTNGIYLFPWEDDFAAARNFSFSKAAMAYCMWMDAEDIILPEDCRHLLQLKETVPPNIDVIMLPYHTAAYEGGRSNFGYYRERIVRNSPAYHWVGQVYEVIVPTGNVLYANAAITHRKLWGSKDDRTLKVLEKIKNGPKGLSPRLRFCYGRELFEHQRYEEAVTALEGFWEDPEGLAENKIDACRILAQCYHAQGLGELAFRTLLRSFILDRPRPEICCELGRLFLEKGEYQNAIYWYETALQIPFRPGTRSFMTEDCYGYLPAIQLCVCYDRLGDLTRAAFYNEKAGSYRPDSPAYQANKVYFSRVLSPEERENGL